MAELKPETKIQKIIEKMTPLADWYAENKPSVDAIRLSADDLKLIKDNEAAAIICGIFPRDGEMHWRNFTLRSAAHQPPCSGDQK